MRSDMFEVIIERPRIHHSRGEGKGRRREMLRHDPDAARGKEPMRLGLGHRSLNENLAPLQRFLQRRVGRRWDDVYSEICAELEPSSTVQKHVLDHLRDFVMTRTYLRDGKVYGEGRFGGPYAVEERNGWRHQFYVCPTTGRLMAVAYKRWRRHGEKVDEVRKLDPLRVLRREDGVWYLVRYAYARVSHPSLAWHAPIEPELRERLGETLYEELCASREEEERRKSYRARVEVSRVALTPEQARAWGCAPARS
jgi:hypothetical protein